MIQSLGILQLICVFEVICMSKWTEPFLELFLWNLDHACRYSNSPYKELSLAAVEQMKITELRLKQLLTGAGDQSDEQATVERRTGQMRGHLGEPVQGLVFWNCMN